jgi:acetylornithine deacetylase/succinyl-diaminopimelate desuccinylase-like protein
LCQAIQQMSFATKDDRFDPPTPSIAVTRLDAGAALHAINVVPDTVTIGIDRRLLPAESIDAATAEVHAIVQRTVREPYRAEFLVPRRWPPCETPPDHLISRAAVAAVQAVGRSGRFGMDLAANDSSFLVEHGIPALLLGPGAPEQAHVTDESLDLDELYAAIAIYAEVALNCVGFDA